MNLEPYKHRLFGAMPGLSTPWKATIDIYERSGDGSWIRRQDRGARFKNDAGETTYRLLHTQRELSPPDYKYIGQTADGNPHLAVLRYGDEGFKPVKPDFDQDEFEDKNVNMREWHAQQTQRNISYWDEDTQSFWTSPVGVALLMFFGAGLFFLFTGYGIKQATAEFANSANIIAEAAKTMG